MRFHPRSILALGAIIGLLVGCAAGPPPPSRGGKRQLGRPAPVASLAEGPLTLDVMDRRWRDAPVQTRIPLRVSGGKGWVNGPWVSAAGESLKMRFWVSDARALRQILPKKNLLAGTHMVCEGWSVQNPKSGKGIEIAFRFANYPARARIEFKADLEQLGEVERFLKLHVLAAQTRDEQLLPPTAASPPPPPPAAPAPAPPSDPAPAPAAPPLPPSTPGLKIVSATAEPTPARAGGEVQLALTYEVGGPQGATLDVLERRVVSRAGVPVGTFEEHFQRAPGTVTSRQPLRIPLDAQPGYYAYRVEVLAGDLQDDYSALFEVR